jgi:MoaA/NifB/PqqE/SkfB family radical SAM enzyme
MTSAEDSDGPWRITFDTNPDDCNIHCIMCEEHSEFSKLQLLRRLDGTPPRRMDISLIRKVVEEASRHGLREIIPSTMGEPLLYNGFEDILELCKEFNVRLNLTTNGTFPRKTVAEWARLIVPVTSDVKISWNGSTRETAESIMEGVKFERILQNVREFVRIRDEIASSGGNRCRVSFQLTFLESNIGELPDMIRLAAELGVDRVKGHHLWVHFREIEQLSLRRSRESIEKWNQVVRLAVEAAETYRLPSGKQVLLENIFPLDPSSDEIAPEAKCPFLGKEAWVSAEGRFNPCCAPDALRRTLGEFGSVSERNLMDIWTGDEYGKLKANYLSRSLCRGCNMRRPESTPSVPSLADNALSG